MGQKWGFFRERKPIGMKSDGFNHGVGLRSRPGQHTGNLKMGRRFEGPGKDRQIDVRIVINLSSAPGSKQDDLVYGNSHPTQDFSIMLRPFYDLICRRIHFVNSEVCLKIRFATN